MRSNSFFWDPIKGVELPDHPINPSQDSQADFPTRRRWPFWPGPWEASKLPRYEVMALGPDQALLRVVVVCLFCIVFCFVFFWGGRLGGSFSIPTTNTNEFACFSCSQQGSHISLQPAASSCWQFVSAFACGGHIEGARFCGVL